MNISAFILSYLAIDFICTMLNRYVFKEENQNENEKEPSARAQP